MFKLMSVLNAPILPMPKLEDMCENYELPFPVAEFLKFIFFHRHGYMEEEDSSYSPSDIAHSN